jgi:hypothetical protein
MLHHLAERGYVDQQGRLVQLAQTSANPGYSLHEWRPARDTPDRNVGHRGCDRFRNLMMFERAFRRTYGITPGGPRCEP